MKRHATAEEIIERLGLRPLPGEGGYYRETYRAGLELPETILGAGYPGARSAATAIFYLLTPGTCSLMHRLPGDELYHFYRGGTVEMLQIGPGGAAEVVRLGADLLAGERCQHRVPGGTWQGSRLLAGGAWALMGTTMAPGFEFADFEPGDRAELLALCPERRALIEALTV